MTNRFLIYVIGIMVLSAILSCGSMQTGSCPVNLDQIGENDPGLVWCGDDTVLVVSEGAPKDEIKDIDKRKKSSKEMALMLAQNKIFEKFKGSCISAATFPNFDDDGKGDAFSAEILRASKSGTLIDCRWDDSQNCIILYKLTRPGLKRITAHCSLD